MSGVTHAVAALTVSLLAVLGIFSCTADSSESGKTASTDSSTPSSAGAPDSASSLIAAGAAPTATATPPASGPRPYIPAAKSYPPDTTDYSRPARPGEKTP
jgi:hypothetical protein